MQQPVECSVYDGTNKTQFATVVIEAGSVHGSGDCLIVPTPTGPTPAKPTDVATKAAIPFFEFSTHD
jgi:hypothetical protein